MFQTRALGVCLALSAAGSMVAGAATHRTSPNVIILTIDTLRADHLASYGYAAASTPNLDKLASEGLRFTGATTPFPRTTPALASLFTGLLPQNHGSREVGEPIRAGTLMAEILGGGGYVTLAVSANKAAGTRANLHRGFDRFVGFHDLKATTAEVVSDAALALVREAPSTNPLFLWVHYLDPHFPYRPPQGFEPQPAAPACRELMHRLDRKEILKGDVYGDRDGISSAALEECIRLYDAEISYTDREVGRLLDGLRAAGRLDGAVIALTSDHGENLGEEELFFEHGPNVHDASVVVPLIVVGPGYRRGVDDGVIRLEDLMPTLFALIGMPAPSDPPMDGLDLSVRFRPTTGQVDEKEPVAFVESGSSFHLTYSHVVVAGQAGHRSCVHGERFSLCSEPGEKPQLYDRASDPDLEVDVSTAHPGPLQALSAAALRWPPEEARQRAVRTRDFKLVEYPRLEGGYRRTLFDLRSRSKDPKDVSADYPDVVARLGTVLERWTASIPSRTPAARLETDLELLRSLGYVE